MKRVPRAGWRRNALLLLLLALALTLFAPPADASQPAVIESAEHCPPLPPPGGTVVNVSTVQGLVNAVNNASSGVTILVADGVYALNGAYLRFDAPGVTLRSASGNREAVILDGNYQTTEIIQIVASNVTIADLTLREAYDHPIHVMSGASSHTVNTLIYNVAIYDPGQQAIKINPATSGYYADEGVIACSHIELTDAGRTHIRDNCYTGGIDAHQARGWTIRDNLIAGFWCNSGLSEHGIHLWRGCRETVIERNVLLDNARGIGLGLVTSGEGRTYPDDPCPAASGYVDDFGGVIRNNTVAANSSGLFGSQSGFDCGICLWNACNVRVLHNTVYTADPGSTFSAIEWRFPNTQITLTNNLTNHMLRERDGASAAQSGNLTNAQAGWFAAAGSGDLHLVDSALAAIDQVSAAGEAPSDLDGEPRPIGLAADVGADEYPGYGFSLEANPVSQRIMPGGSAAFILELQALGAFSGSVNLEVTSPPPGVTVNLEPEAASPPAEVILQVTDTLGGAALPGRWVQVTVTGSAAGAPQVSVTVGLLVGGVEVYLPAAHR